MRLKHLLPFVATTAVLAAPALKSVGLVPRASITKVDGLKFNIDGVTKCLFRFMIDMYYDTNSSLDYAGTNSYWIPFLTNDNDVDVIMSHLASSGLKILRVWGFNDVKSIPGSGTVYFQSFSGSSATINTGANGLQRLDAVVKAADKHGIKLIISKFNSTFITRARH